MDKNKNLHFQALDIKIPIGNYIINILRLSYEAPRPSWEYKNHCHSSYELHYIPEGKGTLIILDRSYDIESGTFYLTGPEVFHQQKADDQNPMSEYCINFEVKLGSKHSKKNNTYIQSEVEDILGVIKTAKFWFGNDVYGSDAIFKKIMLELENKYIGYFTYVQNLASEIILNSVRCFSQEKKSNYLVPYKILNDSRRLVVDDYFRDYDKTLKPESLANKIGVTVRQLNRIMLSYYSMTFKEKLTSTRLEEAKNLLLNTSIHIKDIGGKTGFSTVSYFSRVFNKYYDMSPSEFREMNKRNEK